MKSLFLVLILGSFFLTSCNKQKYKKNCCTGSIRIHTSDFNNNDSVFVAAPNAFTPNGDGINDVFGILTSGMSYDSYSFKIFKNNSNSVIFESYDPNEKWDGTKDGNMQKPGIYTYEFQFYVEDTYQLIEGEGEFCLIDHHFTQGINNCSSCYFGDQFDPRVGRIIYESNESIGCND